LKKEFLKKIREDFGIDTDLLKRGTKREHQEIDIKTY
jgi:hypothetical protein